MCRTGTNLLSVLAPSVNPRTRFARESIAASRQNLAYGTYAESMKAFPFCVVSYIEGRTLLDDVEIRAVSHQLSLTGTESIYLLPSLIVDVIPSLCGLDVADTLSLKTARSDQHHDDE